MRQILAGRTAGRRVMLMALLQALLCALPAGCGGGGAPAASAPAAATPVTATPSGAADPTPPARSDVGFSFTLSATRTTSAGVYSSDGSLVRTLWRGERLAAGTVSRSWDQRDDRGNAVADGDYTIKVVHHDLKYIWEGVVGNSSSQAGAPLLHRAFQVPSSLAAAGSRMHYAVGYNEGQSGIHGFDLAQPQFNRSAVSLVDPFVGAVMVASDGQRLYWANSGGLAKKTFVAAFDLASGAQAAFGAGSATCINYFPDGSTCYPAQAYKSVLNLRDNVDSPPTGLAVQRNGNLLAVAYAGDGAVRLFDKTSGQPLRVLPLALPAGTLNQIAFAPNGDLWALSDHGALRYGAVATAPQLAATVAGLARPLAIAVDPQDDDSVWVADGGASQQLKRFDRQGAAKGTLGRSGGMAGTAAVAADRLCFALTPTQEQTALAVDDERALWVVDSGNNRMLKFAPDGRVTASVAYLPAVYVSSVDAGNPSRVFANFLEFAVDYTRPLSDPLAWTLVRNWLPALPAALRDADSGNRAWGGLRAVQTLANGRTYALLQVAGRPVLLELQADGRMRASTPLRQPASGETAVVLYENGELGWSRTDNGRQSVLRLPLQGFDGNGDPQWAAAPLTLASVPIDSTAPWHRNGTFSGTSGPRFPLTAGDKVVFFNAAVDAAAGFHLGAAPRGGSAFTWQASPGGAIDSHGAFQTRAQDPGLQYGGNTVLANGRDIVYGYHGEAYTDLGNGHFGQANQFMHFRDDGLFLGQFGVPTTQATVASQPGVAGNAFSPTLVRVNGQTYLYHNDESAHAGIHRWRLDGVDAVQELSGRTTLRSSVTLR